MIFLVKSTKRKLFQIRLRFKRTFKNSLKLIMEDNSGYLLDFR